MDETLLDDLMMETKVGQIGRHGIRFCGADYWHDELYGLKHRAIVRYSILDLSEIKVYTENGQYLCTAKTAQVLHPMACLGTEQDRQQLSQTIEQHKGLEKRTFERAELMLSAQPTWAQPVKHDPNLLPAPHSNPRHAAEVHIPEGAVKQQAQPSAPVQPPAPGGRPTNFAQSYERYEWHLKNGCFCDEDKHWVETYKKSEEYRLVYTAFEG